MKKTWHGVASAVLVAAAAVLVFGAGAEATGPFPEPAGGWKSRAIVLSAPMPNEVARFNAFVKNTLAPAGVDTLVLLTRYRYQFKSHPECAASNALSHADARAIKAACDACNVRLVPKMNLLGHQGGKSVVTDGLLAAHPELDESPEKKEVRHNYCRSICPKHPEALKYATDLASEMAEAFGADMMHVGCDEVFEIGSCPRCKGTPTGTLFADWVNGISRHLKAKGVRTMIWSDRLLNAKESGYGVWEASDNGTDAALGKVDKDVICCDWHYENCPKYPSVETLADAGYELYVCPWRYPENARKFLDYAVKHDKGKYLGVMLTTWYPAKDVMDAIEGTWAAPDGKDPRAERAHTFYSLARNFQYVFPKARARAKWTWFDGSEVPMEGKGWTRRDQTETYYDRLPSAGANDVPWAVWNLQKHTAGMSFRFTTDSAKLAIRWKPRFPNLAMPHMPSTGVSGVDVYQWSEEDGKWRYCPSWAIPKQEGSEATWRIRPNALTVVNLPLYNGIEWIRLGVEPGCGIFDPPPRKSGVTKPVVFYGTSTTQGGCVTRPGHCWTTIASRIADVPQVNLGFSGAGKMEDVMLDRVAQIDASVYVLDTAGNMGVKLMEERFEKFTRGLRERRPGVPIVVPAHPWDDVGGEFPKQRAFLRDLCAKLKAEDPAKWKDLYFLSDEEFITGDCDNTVEGAHLNDLGAHRMGASCANLLKKVLRP
ncbi:MAG: family 20 glycosylhydrolase [Kiritimatiellae bacterium]|nr:family 20 glycosylhydrolase [Kiritimatiellia bacterium]